MTLENPKHERFAQALASGKTATDAYIDAGFLPHRGNASRLRTNESIVRRVAELQGGAAKEVELTRAAVLQMLIADREKARGLDQMSAAIKAAELLGKELGMFVERHADVSALYAISDQPMPMDEWKKTFTRPATEH